MDIFTRSSNRTRVMIGVKIVFVVKKFRQSLWVQILPGRAEEIPKMPKQLSTPVAKSLREPC